MLQANPALNFSIPCNLPEISTEIFRTDH